MAELKDLETSTINTRLMVKNAEGTKWEEFLKVKETPDTGGEPETIEVTDLTDRMERYVEGVQANEAKTFTANYTPAAYAKVKAVEGVVKSFAIWYGASTASGPDGTYGAFEFDGTASVYTNGAAVNDAREMTVTIVPQTVVTFNESPKAEIVAG